MAFFTNELTPFFRLMDSYAQEQQKQPSRDSQRTWETVSPKFDLWETADEYVIQGELPGVPLDNVNIEWHKDRLQVSGFACHKRESSSAPSSGDNRLTDVGPPSEGDASHQPTVEDESQATAVSAPVKETNKFSGPGDNKDGKSPVRYWVSERSFGQFNRSFSFPTPVKHDSIAASLNNGVLEIKVPKTSVPAPRRIQISQDA